MHMLFLTRVTWCIPGLNAMSIVPMALYFAGILCGIPLAIFYFDKGHGHSDYSRSYAVSSAVAAGNGTVIVMTMVRTRPRVLESTHRDTPRLNPPVTIAGDRDVQPVHQRDPP